MENYEINKYLEDFLVRVEELETALDINALKEMLTENERLMSDPNFWNDNKRSARILKEVKTQKEKIDTLAELKQEVSDLEVFFEMHKEEEEDLNLEIEALIDEISQKLDDFEVKMLLSKEYDTMDAVIEMHPGAGGTESQDWCEILFRMYRRFCEQKGYEIEILDYLEGEEAGIKSVTFIVHGMLAYGYLKSENGIHRLVRISPFDSNSRRHTSFCAVSVYPQIDTEINIDIKPEEIKVDVYRSSGAGGQSVNTTDSAVRITHFKTGIVVTCQNERSQIQNREKAMQILKSRLYQLQVDEQNEKIKNVSGSTGENSFGSQIRSYVFHPYSMIKDHRTNFEVSNVTPVMDGDLDGFINAFLKSKYNQR